MTRHVRSIVAASACALILLLACPAWAAKPPVARPVVVAGVVKGKVLLDTKRSGRPEEGTPLADVRVTDGVNIVVTGPDGSYTLAIGDDPTTPQKGSRVIAVNWPSGKWPSGRWWVRMDQIADAGHVDFLLRDDEQPLPFAFLQVSDDHAAGWPYNTFGPPAAKLKPLLRFLINTGDTGDCSVSARNAKKFPVPVMTTPGNHDIFNHGPQRFIQDPMAGNGAYTRSLGPVRWSFDYAGVHFVGLDWMDPSIPVEINGNVPQVAAEWLERDLRLVKPGTRIFGFVHFPSGCQKCCEVIDKYKVTQFFGGHIHEYKHLKFAGVPAVTAVNFIAGGNLIVVQKDDFTLAEFCMGCKKKGPSEHIKRCSLSRMPSSMTTFASDPGLANRKLSGTTAPIAASGKGIHVSLELEPGTARKAGLRIAAQPKPVEIAFSGDRVEVAGVPLPFGWEEYDHKTLLWSVTIADGQIEFYGNQRYRMCKPLKVDAVGPVAFFAEGGEATIKRAAVQGK